MDSAKEVAGDPVVTGCEAAAVLEATEHTLDGVAALVEFHAKAAFPQAVALWRDVRDRTLALDQLADAVGVVSTVGMDDAPFGQLSQQMLGCATVGRLTGR